jgi:hypothetical protein
MTALPLETSSPGIKEPTALSKLLTIAGNAKSSQLAAFLSYSRWNGLGRERQQFGSTATAQTYCEAFLVTT